MTQYKYSFKTTDDKIAKTVGRDLAMSPKVAFEMCKWIKGKSTSKLIPMLELVKIQKLAVPYTRATEGAGHKHGMSSGKYPKNGSIIFIKLLKQLEANASNKGLGSNLTIIHACAQRASEPYHYGRKRRVQNKRCHIELAAREMDVKETKEKAPAKKAAKKKVAKSESNETKEN